MDFPVADLFDDELSEQWLLKHFHPQGLTCPHCDARRKYYLAICEHHINFKRITPKFIAQLVAERQSVT